MIPARFRFYQATPDTPGSPWLCTISLQKNDTLMTFMYGETRDEAEEKATSWWEKHSAKYEEKIDKRKTTDPLVKITRTQGKLSALIAEITSQKG